MSGEFSKYVLPATAVIMGVDIIRGHGELHTDEHFPRAPIVVPQVANVTSGSLTNSTTTFRTW